MMDRSDGSITRVAIRIERRIRDQPAHQQATAKLQTINHSQQAVDLPRQFGDSKANITNWLVLSDIFCETTPPAETNLNAKHRTINSQFETKKEKAGLPTGP